MLKKLNTKNSPDQIWYCDDDCDVVVWTNSDLSPRGFQICYDKNGEEKALTFTHGEFSHEMVDEGDDTPDVNHSPILDHEIPYDAKKILKEFEGKAQFMEKIYFDYIRENLKRG